MAVIALQTHTHIHTKVNSEVECREFLWVTDTAISLGQSWSLLCLMHCDNITLVLFTLTIWMNLHLCTGEDNVGDRTGSWEHTVVLAQKSLIPRVLTKGIIISVVNTMFVPLFKDTYGHQSWYITSMKSSQISLWKPKSLHVQKYLSNKIVRTNLLVFIRNIFFILVSFDFCGVSSAHRLKGCFCT